jgi:hypothetical protein
LLTTALYASSPYAGMHEDLMSFTYNKPAKVVWARSLTAGFGMAPDFNEHTILMGYNSATKTVDTICKDITNYQHPLITRDGSKIIYSNATDSSVYSIDWNGQNKKKIARGITGVLWYDTTAKKEYVIYKINGGMQDKNPIYKLNISDSSDTMKLLDTNVVNFTNCTPVWMGVSSDLKCIFFGKTWPNMQLFSITEKKSKGSMSGCYGTMPYDNTYRTLVFDDGHFGFNLKDSVTQQVPSNLQIIDPEEGGTLDHLKFASYSDSVICVIISSAVSSAPGNVMLYKLNKKFTAVTDTVQVTNINKDGLPDFWVESNPTRNVSSLKSPSNMNNKVGISIVHNLLSIKFQQSVLSNIHIDIFSINGKLLKSQKLNKPDYMNHVTVAMDKFQLAHGLYTVSVKNENGVLASAIIPFASR